MCGIIWAKRYDQKTVKKSVLKRFEAQKLRGTQGFGFLEIDNELKVKNWYQSRYENEMREQMSSSDVSEILFHHRTPTSTPNILEATHPIKVSHESLIFDYFVIHNGVIQNAEELYGKFVAQGFVFNTEVMNAYITKERQYDIGKKFNDSEAFAIDIAKTIEDFTIKKTESKGSIAFIAVQVVKGTGKIVNLYFGRNYNPLLLTKTADLITLTSEGGGELVESHALWVYDYNTKEIAKVKELEIGEKYGAKSNSSDWFGAGYKKPEDTKTSTSLSTKFDKDLEDDYDEYMQGYHVSKGIDDSKFDYLSDYYVTRDIEGDGFTIYAPEGDGKEFKNFKQFQDLYFGLIDELDLAKEDLTFVQGNKQWDKERKARQAVWALEDEMEIWDEMYRAITDFCPEYAGV